MDQARPHGRDQVRAALIGAAKQLFREQTPGSVTVRELAKAANVNQGSVHEYFGSKTGLVQATLASLSAELRPLALDATAGKIGPAVLLDAVLAEPAFHRVIAHLLLEGDINIFQTDQSSVPAAVENLRRRSQGGTGTDPRMRAAMLVAATFGWALYRDFIEPALGLADLSVAEQNRQLAALIDGMMGEGANEQP